MKRDLRQVASHLATFNHADMAAGIGALQLVPSNAGRQLRLEVGASLIAALRSCDGRSSMSAAQWRQLLNEPPIGGPGRIQAEDPIEDVFTASVTYAGGSAVVFPGIVSQSVDVLRRLLEAVFLLPGMPPEYVQEMLRVVHSTLRLSDEVAKRAGMSRGVLPGRGSQDEVGMPPPAKFSKLKHAVTFTAEELRAVASPFSSEALLPLTLDEGGLSLPTEINGSDALYSTPILRLKDRYFVVHPSALVVALRHRLITRAIDFGVDALLAQNYRCSVVQRVAESLRWMRFSPQNVRLAQEPTWGDETLWSFDIDKLAHVLVLTDDFLNYQAGEVFGHWQPPEAAQVEERLLSVRRSLHSMATQLEAILHIVVVQGIGRVIAWKFKSLADDPGGACLLTASQPDLGVIARNEADDPLALWKFAKAGEHLRKKTRVLHFSTLDEYALYKAHRNSFYLSDKGLPDLLQIIPGEAAPLRHKDSLAFDIHGVARWEEDGFEDVQRIHPGSGVPIYASDPTRFDRVKFLVEGLGVPIWVVQVNVTEQPRAPYFEICEAVAYWLWQLSPSIEELTVVAADHVEQLGVEVLLEPSPAWTQSVDVADGDQWLEVSVSRLGCMHLKLGAGAARAFSGPTNAGERKLVAALVRGLRESVERLAGYAPGLDLDAIVGRHAPLGPKKKVAFLEAPHNIELANGRLPSTRTVQDADIARLSDALWPEVFSKLSLEPGSIATERRVETLNAAVGLMFSEVERIINSLSAANLLELLMVQNESLVRTEAELRLEIPTRLACFGSEPEYFEQVAQRWGALTAANPANRFLIEYVAAQPPHGSRRFSVGTFDELMALASEIIQKGWLSDAINYGLADVHLNVLGSGRLGMERTDQYVVGVEQYRKIKAGQDVAAAHEWFAGHWPGPVAESEKPRLIEELDAATHAEFGLTMTNFVSVLREAEGLGLELGREPTVMRVDDALEAFGRGANLELDKIRTAVEALALRPRASFLGNDQATEVYPWRFNRELSYVRRPFVIRAGREGGGDELLWGIRHLARSRENLVNLVFRGRFKARSIGMKSFISRMRNEDSTAFNDEVADAFRGRDFIVRKRVSKISGRRLRGEAGEDLGDIDVLVVDCSRRRILAIETKNFEVARTPFEMANEMIKLFRGDRSAVAQHQRRVRWLEEHVSELCEWLDVMQGRKRWRVEPLIVVSRSLVTPLIEKSAIRVVTLDDLRTAESG